jgi:hypothetical protein
LLRIDQREARRSAIVKNLTLFFGVWTALPLVLDEVPYRSTANGSRWTLPFEVRLYMGLGLTWLGARRLGAKGWRISFEHCVAALAIGTMVAYLIAGDPAQWNLRFSSFFCCGVAAYVFRSRIQLRLDLFLACAAALGLSVMHRGSLWALPAKR